MRFAISTSPQRTTWPWLLEVWQRADSHDVFETGWTFDHFYPLFGDSSDDCLEGWITLAALLHETERIRGGVLVTGMVYRHPAVLANMATTLDITSGGRLELGVGAGWNQEECDAYGIELGTLTERFDRFSEGLAVIEGLLTEDRFSFDGRYYRLTNAMNNPKPVQRRLPICIGGAGPRRTIPLVARYANHWNYAGPVTSLDEFRDRRDRLEQACAAIGRDPAEITISALLRYNGDGAALGREIDGFAEAGADVGVISIDKGLDPASVDDLAKQLATVADPPSR
jgi:F420-dependent oxidoreductase-like protein